VGEDLTGAPNASTTGWQRVCDVRSSTTRGNVAATLSMTSTRTQLWNTPITADRDCNLPTAQLYAGVRFRIVRQAAATGAFNVNVKDQAGAVLKALAAGTWAEAECDGTAWQLIAYGAL
jgi:hypothetical protein